MNSTDVLINDLFKKSEEKRRQRNRGSQIAPQTKEMTISKQLSLQRQKRAAAAKKPQNNQRGAVVRKPKSSVKKNPEATKGITIDRHWERPSRKVDATFDPSLPDVHTGLKVVAIYGGRLFSLYEKSRYEYVIGQPVFETALPDHGGGIYVHGGRSIADLDQAFWSGHVTNIDGLDPQKFDYGVIQMYCKGPFVAYDRNGRSLSSQVKNYEALRVKKIAASGVLPIKLVKVYDKQRLLQAVNEYAGPSPQPYAVPTQPQPVAQRGSGGWYENYMQRRRAAAAAGIGRQRGIDPWWQRGA